MYIYYEKGLKTVRKKHGTKNQLFDFFSWEDQSTDWTLSVITLSLHKKSGILSF